MDSQGNKSKRGHPPLNTPLHGKKKSKENELQVCIICELNIQEDTNQTEGKDALFCEGDCQAWVHRKCVGMSKKMYTAWAEADDLYVCHNCSLGSDFFYLCMNSVNGRVGYRGISNRDIITI